MLKGEIEWGGGREREEERKSEGEREREYCQQLFLCSNSCYRYKLVRSIKWVDKVSPYIKMTLIYLL